MSDYDVDTSKRKWFQDDMYDTTLRERAALTLNLFSNVSMFWRKDNWVEDAIEDARNDLEYSRKRTRRLEGLISYLETYGNIKKEKE